MYSVYYAKDYRAMARNSLKGNWGKSVLVYFVAYLLGASGAIKEVKLEGYVSVGSYTTDYSSIFNYNLFTILAMVLAPFAIIAAIYAIFTFVFGASVQLGQNNYFINLQVNPQQAQISNLFERMDIFLQALWLRVVMYFFIFAWTLLLFVPGIIAAYRYSMAPYIMAQNPGIGALEAINISKQMMNGNKGRLFCLDMSFIGWFLLGSVTFGIALLFVYPYTQAARASFYLNLNANYQMTQNMGGVPPYGGQPYGGMPNPNGNYPYGGGPVQGQPYVQQQPYQGGQPVQGQPYAPQQPYQGGQPVQGQPYAPQQSYQGGQPYVAQQPVVEPTVQEIPNSVYSKPEEVIEEKAPKKQEQDMNS